MAKKKKESQGIPYCKGGPPTPGKEPDGVTNCTKCFGRGFTWKVGGRMKNAVPCTRCGGC